MPKYHGIFPQIALKATLATFLQNSPTPQKYPQAPESRMSLIHLPHFQIYFRFRFPSSFTQPGQAGVKVIMKILFFQFFCTKNLAFANNLSAQFWYRRQHRRSEITLGIVHALDSVVEVVGDKGINKRHYQPGEYGY